MSQASRILLIAAAAVSGGMIINLLLLYLFRNQQFLRGLRIAHRISTRARNPWEEQVQAYTDLHEAVSSLPTSKSPDQEAVEEQK